MHKIKTIKIEIRLEIPEFNFEIVTVSSGICFCDDTHAASAAFANRN